MTRSPRMPHRIARLATLTCLVLTAFGIGALITGIALYDARALAFPVVAQIAVVAGLVALGAIPCVMLLRAAQLAQQDDLTRALDASIAGGLVLLPGVGVAALFRILANPCWDNSTCTGGSSVEDTVLLAGILVLLLAAGVALLLSPVLVGVVRRSADRRS